MTKVIFFVVQYIKYLKLRTYSIKLDKFQQRKNLIFIEISLVCYTGDIFLWKGRDE